MATKYIREVTLSGTTPTWNVNKYAAARINGATGNVDITLSIANMSVAVLYFIQDATGDRSLTIDGEDIAVNPEPDSLTRIDVSYFFSTLAFLSNYSTGGGGLPSLTTPTLVATAISDTIIGLVLSDIDENATNIKAYQSPTGSGSWTEIFSGTIEEFDEFQKTGLTAVTEYFYRAKVEATGFAPSSYAYDSATTLAEAVNGIDGDPVLASANTISVPMIGTTTATTAGWSAKQGATVITPDSVTGTNPLVFTFSETFLETDEVKISYNPTTGNTTIGGSEIAAVTDLTVLNELGTGWTTVDETDFSGGFGAFTTFSGGGSASIVSGKLEIDAAGGAINVYNNALFNVYHLVRVKITGVENITGNGYIVLGDAGGADRATAMVNGTNQFLQNGGMTNTWLILSAYTKARIATIKVEIKVP